MTGNLLDTKHLLIIIALSVSLVLKQATAKMNLVAANPCTIARRTIEYYFETNHLKSGSSACLLKEFQGARNISSTSGVFVTLSQNGKTRACWGSLMPNQNGLIQSIVDSTLGALTREYRFAPIRCHEWKHLAVQVTVIRSIQPIHTLAGQNPCQDGLFVRSQGKSAILLPGEARDPYYQLVACKLKAGIHAGEHYQLYRIKADVYK